MALTSTNVDGTLKNVNPDGISVKQAGHLGGIKTAGLHGRIHFVIAGKRGQQVFAQRYSTEDRSRWGKLGGRPKKIPWGEER